MKSCIHVQLYNASISIIDIFIFSSSAFSMNIPNLPIQMVAVTDGGGSAASAFFGTDLGHALITEGNATADRLGAHFTTYTSSGENKCE